MVLTVDGQRRLAAFTLRESVGSHFDLAKRVKLIDGQLTVASRNVRAMDQHASVVVIVFSTCCSDKIRLDMVVIVRIIFKAGRSNVVGNLLLLLLAMKWTSLVLICVVRWSAHNLLHLLMLMMLVRCLLYDYLVILKLIIIVILILPVQGQDGHLGSGYVYILS